MDSLLMRTTLSTSITMSWSMMLMRSYELIHAGSWLRWKACFFSYAMWPSPSTNQRMVACFSWPLSCSKKLFSPFIQKVSSRCTWLHEPTYLE